MLSWRGLRFLFGVAVHKQRHRRYCIGLFFQTDGLTKQLTVLRDCRCGGYRGGLGGARRRPAAYPCWKALS
jgi:hypothetical protein